MKRISFRGWTGERSVAAVFVAGILLLGGTTSLVAHRLLASETVKAFRRQDPQPASLSRRLQRAAAAFENTFMECVGRKFMLTALDIHLRYFLTGEISSRQVLEGRDGWLFYTTKTDGDPLADYQGTNPLPDRELERCGEALRRIRDTLAARGIRLVVLIIPNKEQVYAHYMPATIPKADTPSRTDLLVTYLQQQAGLDVVYPLEEFLAQRDRYRLYYKHDTHWNGLGAWIACQQLRERFSGRRARLEDQVIVAEPATRRDLADLVHMGWYFKDDQGFRVARTGSNLPPVPGRLLLIGDSFRVALEPLLAAEFAAAGTVHRDDLKVRPPDLEGVDILVLEWVERYVDQIPKVASFDWF